MKKIEERVYDKLKTNKYKVATAESCTGGLLAGKLINVSGASDIISMSFVTYSNEAKQELVNVKQETIEKYNVVSEEVAKEMAIGAMSKAKSEVGLSTTGLAGIKDKVYTYTKVFKNKSRQGVRNASVKFILEKLEEIL